MFMFDKIVIVWTQMIEEGGAEQIAKMFMGSCVFNVALAVWCLLLTITQESE